ncbi:hypothetical protein EV379_1249 [Microterricola gilva]|uniref:Tail assembly chaperone n=2 Tax=Microterricola gilva TaxID=393267 RepID=A0A4Q8AKK9_9MICO|nr:hypothetical protein EV379_1249 [Microterricola gilva]
MTALSDAIAAQKVARAAGRETDTVEVLVGDRLTTLKFTEMDGLEWRRIVELFPPRRGVQLDARYNYNTLEGSLEGAKHSGVELIEGEEAPPLKVDLEANPPVDEWADMFSVLSSADLNLIAATLWILNEYAPSERKAKAKKALTAPAKPKRASRAKSVSR